VLIALICFRGKCDVVVVGDDCADRLNGASIAAVQRDKSRRFAWPTCPLVLSDEQTHTRDGTASLIAA
jgi:hypothetical protein